MKDPAFLFYSKDFFEGTRLMLPEERACYIDLMIYQHQNGLIPLDLKRVLMYCSGVNEATLKATLEAKFKQTDDGYYNERLREVVEQRAEYAEKQSNNGKVGQVFKKVKTMCNASELKAFKNYFYNELGKEKALDLLDKNKATLKDLLKASLKHLVNEDANVNEDINIDYKELKDFYNSNCGEMPKCREMTPKRKEQIKNRIEQDGKETLIQALKTAFKSDFLQGKSDRGFKADIEWITKKENFIKILEGKYNNSKLSKPKLQTNRPEPKLNTNRPDK